MAKFVSYLRVSTAQQGASGLGLEAQREAVARYLRGCDGELVQELVEVESGKQNGRPQLADALRMCRVDRATLLIAKLDRLARNVYFISGLMESGVDFVAVDNPTANRLIVHILAAVAEDEAKAISKRTTAALAAAKARGTKLGGLRGPAARMRNIAYLGAAASVLKRSAAAAKANADLLPIIRAIQADGTTSLRGLAAELNKRGHKARRGGQWSAAQVATVIGCSESAHSR